MKIEDMALMMVKDENEMEIGDKKYDLLSMIIAWESGELSEDKEFDF